MGWQDEVLIMKKVFVFLLFILMATNANAYIAFQVNGINYYTNSDGTVTVTGTNDGAAVFSGNLKIPPKVSYNDISYTVVSIGEKAFSGYSGITNVVLPDSLVSIGFQSFLGCTGLTSIVLPNSVTSIGKQAFKDCI